MVLTRSMAGDSDIPEDVLRAAVDRRLAEIAAASSVQALNLPTKVEKIKKVFLGLTPLKNFEHSAFQALSKSLLSTLKFYSGAPASIFVEQHVPTALNGSLSTTLAAILEEDSWSEDDPIAPNSDEKILLQPAVIQFFLVAWVTLLPPEVAEWEEHKDLKPLAVYRRLRTICMGPLELQRQRLVRSVLAHTTASYGPNDLRCAVTALANDLRELLPLIGDSAGAMRRVLLEYLVRNGNSHMDPLLQSSGVDVFDADFSIDTLVAKFQRHMGSIPSSTNSGVRARDTGVVATPGETVQALTTSTAGGASNGGTSRKKKRNPQSFDKGAKYDPKKAGECQFCKRAHPLASCRAKQWLQQVIAVHPEAALQILPPGAAVQVGGKQYTNDLSGYSPASPRARDTSALGTLPQSGITAVPVDSSAVADTDADECDFMCDTGADMHMTRHAEWFHSIEPVNATVTFGGKASSSRAAGIGTIKLRVPQRPPLVALEVTLTNVLYVPDLADDLLCPKTTYSSGGLHVVDDDSAFMQAGEERLPLSCDDRSDLWLSGTVVHALSQLPDFVVTARVAHSQEHLVSAMHLHRSLGHRSDVSGTASVLANVDLLEDDEDGCGPNGFDVKSCETCLRTQMRRRPFPKKATHEVATAPNDCWVIDNVPQDRPGVSGETNILLVLDEYSRFPLAFLPTFTRKASELVPIFERLARRFGAPVIARCDNEFVASDLYHDWLHRHNIEPQATVPYSPQQNGIAEARQGGFMSKIVAALSESKLPRNFWPWAAPHVASVVSFCTTKKNSGEAIRSPYIAYFGEEPDLLYVQPWGALCFVVQRKEVRGGKLEDSAWPAVFLGTPPGVKGALVMYADGRMDVSHDLYFPSTYTPGEGATRLGLTPSEDDAEAAQAAALGQRFDKEGPSWVPEDGDDALPRTVDHYWLPNTTAAPDTHTASGEADESPEPHGFQAESDFDVELDNGSGGDDLEQSPHSAEQRSAENQGGGAGQGLRPVSPTPSPRTEPPPSGSSSSAPLQEVRSFSYSDSVDSTNSPGVVTGTTSRGRTTKTPGNWWQVGAARSALPCITLDDDDYSLFDDPFVATGPLSEVPHLAKGPPPAETLDVHCRLSLLQPEWQRAEGAEPVYYFRHTNGTLRDVQKCGQPERYYDALGTEMTKICEEEVVKLVELPEGESALDSFVFFKDKFLAGGEYDKTKARLVVRGDHQEWWQYDDIYASTLAAPHFRLFLAICASEGWEPFDIDLRAAFLQIPNPERLYLRLYPWMEPFLPASVRAEAAHLRANGCGRLALEMLMTIYGIRQGPHNLQEHLSANLSAYGLTQAVKAPNLWMLKDSQGRLLLIVEVFADDIAVAGATEERDRFVKHLVESYDVGTLRPMTSYIGYRVVRDAASGDIHISMPDRIVQALDRFNLLHAKSMPTPMPVPTKPLRSYVPDEGSEEALQCAELPYAHIIGVLNYLAQTVRPDIAIAVRMLSSFTKSPGLYHWKCAKRILRYLKGTRDLGLCYRGGQPLILGGNSDASHGGNAYDSRTFSGYFTVLSGAPIHWAVHKQDYVPNGTGEAELVGLFHLATDVAGFRMLMDELGYEQPVPSPLQCDSTNAIHWAYRRGRVDKIKHIRMKYHRVQELVADKEVSVAHLRSEHMPADMLTKVLPASRFEHLRAFIMA